MDLCSFVPADAFEISKKRCGECIAFSASFFINFSEFREVVEICYQSKLIVL